MHRSWRRSRFAVSPFTPHDVDAVVKAVAKASEHLPRLACPRTSGSGGSGVGPTTRGRFRVAAGGDERHPAYRSFRSASATSVTAAAKERPSSSRGRVRGRVRVVRFSAFSLRLGARCLRAPTIRGRMPRIAPASMSTTLPAITTAGSGRSRPSRTAQATLASTPTSVAEASVTAAERAALDVPLGAMERPDTCRGSTISGAVWVLGVTCVTRPRGRSPRPQPYASPGRRSLASRAAGSHWSAGSARWR